MTSTDDREVRAEDAFDVGAVSGWLARHAAPAWRDRLAGTPQVRQFAGGASNLTFLLRYDDADLILRRAPAGTKAKGAHDMRREFTLQKALKPVFGYVADMVAFCDDEAVLGSDFYVMERLEGVIPRSEMPVPLSVEQARALCFHMLDVLVELHRVDVAGAGLSAMSKGPGYVGRQVGGWSMRCRNARTDDAPGFEETMAWLAEHEPADVGSCVIHNDFKMDNLVLSREDPTRVVGVLDWELATIGDPLMDLGGDLAFWVQADDDPDFQRFRRVPTHLPGMLTREQFVAAYCDRMGLTLTPQQWLFYEVFGLFRLAVISQQIYFRYFHQQTTNEEYAVFGPAVHVADRRIKELLR